VVPAPARARYVAHLADCGSCRTTLIKLTPATGAATRSEHIETKTKAGLWQKLAAIFSPPVLHYGVPALALTAVIAISFIALRERRPDLVARNETPASASPVSANQPQAPAPVAESKSQEPARVPVTDSRLSTNSSLEPKPTPGQ
jgi:hypothetical protein